jgi:hypothetical protein
MPRHLPCTLSRLSSSEPSAIVPMSGCLPGLHPIHLYRFRTGMTDVPFAAVSGDALSAYSRCSTMSAGGSLKTTKAIPHFVPDVYSAARRRDDLNSGLLAAIARSRFWHKADMPTRLRYVRFGGQSGLSRDETLCLLSTQSRRRRDQNSAVQATPWRSVGALVRVPARRGLRDISLRSRLTAPGH